MELEKLKKDVKELGLFVDESKDRVFITNEAGKKFASINKKRECNFEIDRSNCKIFN